MTRRLVFSLGLVAALFYLFWQSRKQGNGMVNGCYTHTGYIKMLQDAGYVGDLESLYQQYLISNPQCRGL